MLVLLNGLRLGFSAFEVKVLDEHILLCGERSLSIVISFLTKMAFRGLCIGTVHMFLWTTINKLRKNVFIIEGKLLTLLCFYPVC